MDVSSRFSLCRTIFSRPALSIKTAHGLKPWAVIIICIKESECNIVIVIFLFPANLVIVR